MNKFEKQQVERQLGSKEEQARRDKDTRLFYALSEVVKEHSGRVVLKALLNSYPVDVDDFSPDPYRNAYNQGQRAVAIAIRNFIKHAGVDVLHQIENEEI